MKITIKHIISVCALFIIGLSACSDDSLDNYSPVNAGDAVKFSASSKPASRTIYDDENIFQINWKDQDLIKIYSNKAFEGGVDNADYTVTPIETPGDGTNKLYNTGTIAAVGGTQLQWADNAEHKFIGVYPNNIPGMSVDFTNNTVTLPMNRHQRAIPVLVSGDNYYSKKYSNYTYYAKPDMKYAYMVAYNALTPNQAAASNSDVFLDFKPVMTAIEVVVKGRATNNKQSVQLTGVSVVRQFPIATDGGNKGNFMVDAQTGKMVYDPKAPVKPGVTKETTFVALDTEDGLDYVTLQEGQSIVMTVFIPPMDINSKYPIQVRAHATGSVEVHTKDITNEILAANKRRITLPNFPETDAGNNWITPLDDNIYVSQMSIPGSHDAATGEEMISFIGDMFAQTQDNTLQTQWNLGVRCFDLRPAIHRWKKTNELWLYHGVTRVSISWASTTNTLRANLQKNPGEFAIVLFRHEDESTADKDNNIDHFNQKMTDWVNANKDIIVEWKPDLTIGEARGKIILISRFEEGTWQYGAFTNWNHSDWMTEAPGKQQIYTYQNAAYGNIYIQDNYNPKNADVKYNNVKSLLDISKTAHTDFNLKNVWFINHLSGYSGTTSTGAYRKNAANINMRVYNYLQTITGSTGIMMFDYSGIKKSGSYNVNGDVMLQAVINNNYKYRMQRKGE